MCCGGAGSRQYFDLGLVVLAQERLRCHQDGVYVLVHTVQTYKPYDISHCGGI